MDETAEKLFVKITDDVKRDFEARRSVLSFQQYIDDVYARPKVHLRNAARYLGDVVTHFGSREIDLPTGTFTRFNLFDAPFAERGKVVGQERVQENLVRLLMNFVRSGRVDRLVLLHGPNGSAKTSLIQALALAAEHYSHTEQGALYRFNWVFPTQGARKGTLGFGSKTPKTTDSYAHLEGTEVEARVPCEFKDHPLLLLAPRDRHQLFADLRARDRLPSDHAIPEVLLSGDLSSKNRAIFDALLTSNHGDVAEVLRHVQVERFYFSRRYRKGIVSVEPQMSVDAYSRQVTADRSLAALPPALHHMALFETGGPLNDANRGILEFNDLLKRPLESWKYLLVATEQAAASLDHVSLFLDVMMLASSNEVHLAAFKEHHDWPSFKGRIELVKAPYLLRVSDELLVYQEQIPRALTGLHIAPHALTVAARFAVLTRLEPPTPSSYPEKARELAGELSPEEKLELYDTGAVPERLSQKERRDLREIADALYAEYKDSDDYEGKVGASVREIRMALLNAAQDPRFDHLSPAAVIDELRALTKETSSYPFLRRESVRGYRDAVRAVLAVEAWYVRVLDEEIRSAMGLVETGSHEELFQRYVRHVSAWTKKEKLPDPLTGKLVEPDKDLMKRVEDVLLAEDEESSDFRRSVIAQIGAAKLENPDREIDYLLLFGSYMKRLEEDYYAQHKKTIEKISETFLRLLDDDTKDVDPKIAERARTLRARLHQKGYTDASAKAAVAYLMRKRR